MKPASEQALDFWTRDNDDCKNMSHWKGYNTRFEKHGNDIYARVDRLCDMGDRPFRFDRAMDWGCGGGGIVSWLVRCTTTTIAVDISEASLTETIKRAIVPEGSELLTVRAHAHLPWCDVGGDLDLFVSTCVFQHILSQQHGEDIMRYALSRLKPGALALVQIATLAVKRDSGDSYEKYFTRYTTWGKVEFANLCRQIGFELMWVDTEPDYAYYYLRKPDAH